MTERFEKIVEGFEPLTIFAKSTIRDIWQGFKYAKQCILPLAPGMREV